MNYLGIDIGTSGCKALVFNENGSQVSRAYREYPLIMSADGGAELDSRLVLDSCLDVIREASMAAGTGTVRGIGISSQGETFTPVDRDGEPLSNGMVSSDVRSAPFIEKWRREFGEDRLYEITGHSAHPMFSVFKLDWLKANNPDAFNAASKFLCYEDLLASRLGLEPAMGWPLAGRTMMFDVRRHEWNADILDFIGMHSDQLAQTLPSGSVSGRISNSIADALGLAPDAIVVAGGHDQPMGALGAGVTEPGLAMYATGTVECITPAFKAPVFSENLRISNLCTYDHALKGMYATVAFSLTGGNILRWFRDEFGAQEIDEARSLGVDAYEILLKKAARRPSSLLVLPYFTPSGTPYFDTATPGAIIGLRLSTSREEFIRGLLEGVAMEMRLNLQILQESGCDVKEIRLIGGGAKSAFWNQLKADVIGKPLTTLNITEAGCLGAAMLAYCADSGESVSSTAKKWVKPIDTIAPDEENSEYYTRQFQTYRQLYPAIRELYS